MIITDNLEVALNNAKVGDALLIKSESGTMRGIIVINQEKKYNVWFDEGYNFVRSFGDIRWYNSLKELIEGYWETWSEHGEYIEIELDVKNNLKTVIER